MCRMTRKMIAATVWIVLVGPAASHGGENGAAGGTRVAAALREAQTVQEVSRAIEKVGESDDLDAVPELVRLLDDRRLLSGKPDDPRKLLVCDYAAMVLEDITGVHHGRHGVYGYFGREERDKAIRSWKKFWEANRRVPPGEWLGRFLAPKFRALKSATETRKIVGIGEELKRSIGTSFGLENFTAGGFEAQFHAAVVIALDFWQHHRGAGREELVEAARDIEAIFAPAREYRSFLRGANIAERVMGATRPPRIRLPGPPPLVRVDEWVETFTESRDDRAKQAAAEELERLLGTDFGYRAFARHDVFQEQAEAARRVLADWWKTHRGEDLEELTQSVEAYETILLLSRRYAGMVAREVQQADAKK